MNDGYNVDSEDNEVKNKISYKIRKNKFTYNFETYLKGTKI